MNVLFKGIEKRYWIQHSYSTAKQFLITIKKNSTEVISLYVLTSELLQLPVNLNKLYRVVHSSKYCCNFLLTLVYLDCHFLLDKLCARILLKIPMVQFHSWHFQTEEIPWIFRKQWYHNCANDLIKTIT